LSFIGKNAYITVIVLTLVGAATDILDGKVARHYLGENKEGRLGKHDAEIDTLFVLCVLGYFSFSGVVIHRAIGLGWIGLVLIVVILSKRNLKVLVISEVTTVIALLVIGLLYDPLVFGLIIGPAMAVGIIINRRRVLYLLFDYWPSLFSK
jgi:phosphatidylglycerophosphate synthase